MTLTPDEIDRLQELTGDRQPATITKDSEYRCPDCRARVTRTPNMGEVGHKTTCERRDRYTGYSANGEFHGERWTGEEVA